LYLYQASLGLTAQEIWFTSAILAHKWDADLPYPNLHTMAEQSGLSLRQLKRIRAGLEEKGTLQVQPRYDATGRQEANSYDFSRLFAQLESAIMADPPGDNGLQAEGNLPPLEQDDVSPMSFVARFGRVIVRAGIAAIPQALFTYQQPLGLSPQQIWFISYILAHRWSTNLPYPSLRRMADRTGYSERHLHTIKDELVQAGYLVLIERHSEAGGRDNNAYDFSNLLQALNTQLQQTGSPGSNTPTGGMNPQPYSIERSSGEGDTQFIGGEGHDVQVVGGRIDHRGEGHRDHMVGGHAVQWEEGHLVHRRGRHRQQRGETVGSVGSRTLGSAGRVTPSSEEIESDQEEPNQEEQIGSAVIHSQDWQARRVGEGTYLEQVIGDISRELDHPLRRTADEQALEARSNIAQARRLWEVSGLLVEEFVTLMLEARRRTQMAKGKQGLRRLARPMAYFFRVLERSLAAEADTAERTPETHAQLASQRTQPSRGDSSERATAHQPLDPEKYLRGKYAHLFNRNRDDGPA
jgi:hypothetical protein